MDKVLSNAEFMDRYMDYIPDDMLGHIIVEEMLGKWINSLDDPDTSKDKEVVAEISKDWGFKKDSPMWYIVTGFIGGMGAGMDLLDKIQKK